MSGYQPGKIRAGMQAGSRQRSGPAPHDRLFPWTHFMILVTGGAGYIGSHTVKALKKAGFQPLIFDNFSTGHRSFIKGTPAFEGDVINPDDLARAFAEYPIDGVLHFAGRALVGESIEKPELYYDTNLQGGLNLLNAMKTCGVKFLIFSSSCATYGTPQQVPISEDPAHNPNN